MKKRKITYQYLLNYAGYYLGKYNATYSMTQDILKKRVYKNLPENDYFEDYAELITKVLENLVENNLINDKRYVQNFINSNKAKKISNLKIKNFLNQRGIDENLINYYLPSANDTELDRAIHFLKKYSGKEISSYDYQKILGKLARAGFPYSISKSALDSIGN